MEEKLKTFVILESKSFTVRLKSVEKKMRHAPVSFFFLLKISYFGATIVTLRTSEAIL